MSVQDLGRYNVNLTFPTVGRFEGAAADVTVRTMASPSSGGLTISQILALLEPLGLAGLDRRSVEAYHLIAEASNLAFVDRIAYLGDDEFVDLPTQGFLDDEYVAQRRQLIDPGQARDSYEPGDPFAFQPGDGYRVDARDVERFQHLSNASGRRSNGPPTDAVSVENTGQTTHFTTADGDGNLVSWTSTIEQLFGSGNMVPGRGFMLNNELTDFDSFPGGPNEVQPEKRPLSSTSPTVVFRDGEPFFTVGSPGGFTIITTVSQIILNVAEFGMSLEEAVAEPRIFAFGDGRLFAEEAIPESVRTGLEALGHDVVTVDSLGNAQAIQVDGDTYVGVGDFRRDSSAAGP
ncbi:gamma-glutamyltransferase family protein [Halobacteriaceae archaeon GCM10025711]